MTDLTEQMKKGELPYAEYYIKLAGGEYTNDVWDFNGWQSFNKEGDVVIEVLAPVPSYKKYISLVNWKEDLTELCTVKERIIEKYENIDTWWKAEYTELKGENEKLKSKLQLKETAYEFDTARLEEENSQLKELLKECVELMGYGTTAMHIDVYRQRKKDVLNGINQALGE